MAGSDTEAATTTDSIDRTYRLGYGLWHCEHCGSQFVAMTGCSQCGKDGPQVDERVNRRRAIVERVRPCLDGQPAAEPLDVTSVWTDIASWMDRLYESLASVGREEPGGEEQLAGAISVLAGLRAAGAATPRRRPLVNLWREIDRMLEVLDGLVRANLDALEAPTPQLAQGHEARAQQLIDAASERANVSARLLDRLGMPVEGSFFEAFARDTEHAYSAADAQGLTDFDAKGAVIYGRITGGAECPRGLGFSLMLIESKIRDGFDAERFDREVRRAFVEFTERPNQLDALIADPQWRKDVRRASRELFSASVEIFDQAQGSIKNDWFETRALLRLSLLLTEGVAPIYLKTLLVLGRKGDWRRYRGADPGQLLKETSDAKLADLVVGIDVGVRDADAHRAYEQLANGIALTSRARVGEREFSAEELLDLTLAATESCLLLHTALTCAMTVRGVPIEELDAASDLIPKDEQIRMLLTAAGLRGVTVEASDNALRIRGIGTLDPPHVLSASAAVEATGPEDVDHLEFVITDAEGVEWRAIGPLEPIRRARVSADVTKECATVETAARWRVDGEPVFSQPYVRRWSAIRLGQTRSGDLRVTLQVISTMSEMAGRIADNELQRALESYGRLTRARLYRLPPPKKDAWAADQIVQWMNDTPSPPKGLTLA